MRIIFILLLCCSCSASWHLKKAIKKGALVSHDTVYQEVKVIVPEVKTDTIFKPIEGDTVFIQKERLKIKYVKLPSDSVYIHGECESDTVKIEVPITITKNIEAKGLDWKWLFVAFFVGMVFIIIIRNRLP